MGQCITQQDPGLTLRFRAAAMITEKIHAIKNERFGVLTVHKYAFHRIREHMIYKKKFMCIHQILDSEYIKM